MLSILLFFSWFTNQQYQVMVPIDHQLQDSKKIPITYTIIGDFDKNRESIFLVDDPLLTWDELFDIAKGLQEKWNIVRVHGRQQSEEIKKLVVQNEQVNWKLAYRFYNQQQAVMDLEYVRKAIVGDQKIILLGQGSAAAGLLHYSTNYPESVSKSVWLSPLILDVHKNLGFFTPIHKLSRSNALLNPLLLFYFSSQTSLNLRDLSADESLWGYFSSFLFPNFQYAFLRNVHLEDIATQVRLFEHSYAFGLANDQRHPFGNWLREASSDLWVAHQKERFDVYGIRYDQPMEVQEATLILAGKFDLLVSYHSYEVLSELVRMNKPIIINDGHGLTALHSSGLLPDLIHAFLTNDAEGKVRVFEEMKRLGLYPARK
ncbi:hypothetical protein [Mongoliitalea daihaiensis]|uniref:hypothetical protein n=1 Tax=Mongoliitalea daihaiensis TaxID=2782006 RepID=UPI001F199775|nr:hypothetical protein [Mongoliitalea daihaiensis]UJP66512.1 hypothetical protein IPZ59_07910 [Mongoliitalea daihaiensis]